MSRTFAWCAAVVLGLAAGAAAPTRAEEPQPVIEDVLEILKQRGLVDEGQYNELVAKNQSYEEQHQNLLGRIEFSGDMRMRYENFWFDEDELGLEFPNRNRLRYRARLQAKAAINDYVDAVLRLASGEGDIRSTNRTLGVGDDFDFDEIFVDLAYLSFKAPEEWLPDTSATARAGKMPNPFLWKQSRADLLWDADITPEGLGVQLGYKPGEDVTLFANAGYYIVDENGSSSDPHVLGIQAGASWAAAEQVELGARGTWYSWSSLNDAFFGRMAVFGNVADGLADTDSLDAGELAAYVRYSGIDGWPVLVFGQIAKNFDAQESALFDVGEEDMGWGVGLEVGDKKELAVFGVGYFYLEANVWPARFTDSDWLDGFTNRKGWGIWATKEILPHTDLNVELFLSDRLRDEVPGLGPSLAGADRIRLRTDIQVKF
jgi:hypothetical protein